MGLQTIPRRRLMRVPSRFIFDAKVNLPVKMLLRAECQAPFIVANGQRSMEFELIIDVADLHPENPTLIVTCQNESRVKIFGLITIGFGASKDADNSIDADRKRFLTHILHTILIIYQATEFMEFVKQGRLRQLTSAELWSSLNFKAYQELELLNINSYLYQKWILCMGTKYFDRLINENSAVNHATLSYSGDIVTYVSTFLSTAKCSRVLKKIRQTIELLCILKLNMDLAIETLAIELESTIFAKWKGLDLDELVEILTLPKCSELKKLKVAVSSVIIDVNEEQFHEQSTGKRCALYRDLIFSGALDETTKQVGSELEKIKVMSYRMGMVEKRVEFDHFWI
uniref:Uncharacterized protein n=1 Tax=Onchocerca volvulus TaxID=6282 RepID=A0A8R1TRF0_ONCVO